MPTAPSLNKTGGFEGFIPGSWVVRSPRLARKGKPKVKMGCFAYEEITNIPFERLEYLFCKEFGAVGCIRLSLAFTHHFYYEAIMTK